MTNPTIYLQTLVAAIDAVGAKKYLNNPKLKATVFAPTNEAFASLFVALNTTPELALQNTVLVKGVLDYHLIPDDVIYTKDLEQIQSWGTNLGNQLLTIVKAGKAKVRIYYGAMKFDGTTDLKFGGYAQITVPNVKADKAVVQVINRVLIPALPQA